MIVKHRSCCLLNLWGLIFTVHVLIMRDLLNIRLVFLCCVVGIVIGWVAGSFWFHTRHGGASLVESFKAWRIHIGC